jgi:hypothetical protein
MAKPIVSDFDAHRLLAQAHAEGRVRVHLDTSLLARPASPAYDALDVFVPALVLMCSSLTLLFAFGLVEWIVALSLILVYQLVGAPLLVRVRARRRAWRAVFDVGGFDRLWRYGGIALVATAQPDQCCVAPSGNWKKFVLVALAAPPPAAVAS